MVPGAVGTNMMETYNSVLKARRPDEKPTVVELTRAAGKDQQLANIQMDPDCLFSLPISKAANYTHHVAGCGSRHLRSTRITPLDTYL